MIAVQYLFSDLYLVVSLFFLGCLISFSGCVGLSVYKKGLEKFDMIVNISVLFLLILISRFDFFSVQDTVFLSIICISFKFSIQILLSYFIKSKVEVV